MFDGGDTRARANAAATTHALTAADYRRVEADTAVAVVQAYGDAMVAEASKRAAHGAIESATRDMRAEARQTNGRATAADVLSLKVHLAEMQAREVSARGDVQIARARLNSLLGVPVDTRGDLQEPNVPSPP